MKSLGSLVHSNFSSFRNRTGLVLICGMVVMCLLALQSREKRLANLMMLYSTTLHNPTLVGSEVEVFRLCQSLFDSPDVLKISVNGFERTLCEFSKEGLLFGSSRTSEIRFSDGSLAGKVTVEFSLLDDFLAVLLVFAVFALIFILYSLFFKRLSKTLTSNIVDPIEQVTDQMKGGGKIALSGSDYSVEVENLVHEFNEMIDASRAYELELMHVTSERVVVETSQQLAHDIKSPLSVLYLATGSGHEITGERMALMRQAIDRIRTIADELLNRSREARNLAFVSIFDSIERLINEKRVLYAFESYKFDWSGVGHDIKLPKIESGNLERVVSNLINNSVDALGQGGIVSVSVNTEGEFVTISIYDNGRGIPPEHMLLIGQRGASFGKSDKGGSGLGLYHAKKTVESMRGKFAIDSELGVGTTVTIHLPK